MQYEVTFQKNVIGTAEVTKEGLYYRIVCTCSPVLDGIYKLQILGKFGCENLGTCVLQNGKYIVETRIPIKRVGEGGLTFRLVQKIPETGKFYPISHTEPFPELMNLKNAVFAKRNGALGVVIRPNPTQAQPGNGQTP